MSLAEEQQRPNGQNHRSQRRPDHDDGHGILPDSVLSGQIFSWLVMARDENESLSTLADGHSPSQVSFFVHYLFDRPSAARNGFTKSCDQNMMVVPEAAGAPHAIEQPIGFLLGFLYFLYCRYYWAH